MLNTSELVLRCAPCGTCQPHVLIFGDAPISGGQYRVTRELMSMHSWQTARVSKGSHAQLPLWHVNGKDAAGLLFSANNPLYTAAFKGNIGTYPAITH